MTFSALANIFRLYVSISDQLTELITEYLQTTQT